GLTFDNTAGIVGAVNIEVGDFTLANSSFDGRLNGGIRRGLVGNIDAYKADAGKTTITMNNNEVTVNSDVGRKFYGALGKLQSDGGPVDFVMDGFTLNGSVKSSNWTAGVLEYVDGETFASNFTFHNIDIHADLTGAPAVSGFADALYGYANDD